MLEKLPSAFGRALGALRPGLEKLVINDRDIVRSDIAPLRVASSAFQNGGKMPKRHTADGEGISPPLAWSGVPQGAASLILIVEDADSPTPQPLVHAIAYDLPPQDGTLEEGALSGGSAAGRSRGMGRNSYWRARYLPPDPPPGHGPHRYAFQLFAFDKRPALSGAPGRRDVTKALRGHVLAAGSLIGIYERG